MSASKMSRLNNKFDEVGFAAPDVNNDDNEWLFKTIMDLHSYLNAFFTEDDEISLNPNMQYNLSDSTDMEVFIDFRFKNCSDRAISEFIQTLFEYYKDSPKESSSNIHDITININKSVSSYDYVIAVEPYMVKPKKNLIYYSTSTNSFRSAPQKTRGGNSNVHSKLDDYDFEKMDENDANAVKNLLNDINDIMTKEESE